MNVLSIWIHMDDCENGMGGAAYLLAQAGAEVTFLNIKPYMHSKGGSPEADRQSMLAAEKLGAKKIILDYAGTKYYKNNEKTIRMTEELRVVVSSIFHLLSALHYTQMLLPRPSLIARNIDSRTSLCVEFGVLINIW